MAKGAGRLPLRFSLLLAALPCSLGPGVMVARAESPSIPLECRLGDGAWQPCRMQVVEIGSHWFLLVAGQRFEFRHDQRGGVSMQAGGGGWRSVSSRWEKAENLCWDGVCARGSIPLD